MKSTGLRRTMAAGCMTLLLACCALVPGCASAPCGDAYGEIVAHFELEAGELCTTAQTLRVEARGGLTGLWVGGTYFRVVVARNASRAKNASCDPVTDEELAATRAAVMRLFKDIFSDEIGRLPGLVDYPSSLIAFDKEMTGLLKMGTVTTRELGGGRCVSIFQVASKGLRQLVHRASEAGY